MFSDSEDKVSLVQQAHLQAVVLMDLDTRISLQQLHSLLRSQAEWAGHKTDFVHKRAALKGDCALVFHLKVDTAFQSHTVSLVLYFLNPDTYHFSKQGDEEYVVYFENQSIAWAEWRKELELRQYPHRQCTYWQWSPTVSILQGWFV